MPNPSRDQFDDIPVHGDRVGAHRAPRRRGRGWIAFAWAALATGVLVVGGLLAISVVDPEFSLLPEAETSQTAAPDDDEGDGVQPVTDPGTVDPALGLAILVLNGTATSGLQESAGAQLESVGWPVDSLANASSDTEETTIVYYRSAEYEGVALGLVQLLGVGEVQLSSAFEGAPVTIVLGSDYAPPQG